MEKEPSRKKFRKQFDEWCEYLEGLGYTNYHNNYKK